MTTTLHSSSVAALDPVVLYEILRLRVDVFVVEQDCPYPELDGRDLEPTTRLLWSSDDDGRVTATLRVLHDFAAVLRRRRRRGPSRPVGAGSSEPRHRSEPST